MYGRVRSRQVISAAGEEREGACPLGAVGACHSGQTIDIKTSLSRNKKGLRFSDSAVVFSYILNRLYAQRDLDILLVCLSLS